MNTRFRSLLLSFLLLPVASLACDNHGPSARPCTWHVNALKPLLLPIASHSLDTAELMPEMIDVLDRGGAHLGEAYATLGLLPGKQIDILQLYAVRAGKPFVQDPAVSDAVNTMIQLREKKKFMAYCAEDLQQLRISLAASVKDTLLLDALGSAIDVFEQSGSFWDLAASEYNLAKESGDPVRREFFDLVNFSNYYMALRRLGLDHYGAHALASLETAYAAARCDHCAVW